MKPQYEPITTDEKLGYLVEECGEVLAAVGKTQRWGLESVNPEIPVAQQETNREWVLRELKDLRSAIRRVEQDLAIPAEEGEHPTRCLGCGLVGRHAAWCFYPSTTPEGPPNG